jgi:phosphoglycolate phosphatase-like HAD superfamily hydrolase
VTGSTIVVFDLDGTLVDSDAALLAPFDALGVDHRTIPLGLPLGEACRLAGISPDEYLAHYDVGAVQPFAGVEDLLARLDRWAVCSNKDRASGRAELARLGWAPEVALFSDDFEGRPKELALVLGALGAEPGDAVYVGDTAHDRAAAAAAGVRFAFAGWNPRATPASDDRVLARPADLLEHL